VALSSSISNTRIRIRFPTTVEILGAHMLNKV
jgi:hypothetical protein